jgi:sugar lactone lactonase YvrE
MLVTPDNATLIVAESYGNKLTAFGPGSRTLFMTATVWNGPENMFTGPRTGQVLTADAPAPGAGWP